MYFKLYTDYDFAGINHNAYQINAKIKEIKNRTNNRNAQFITEIDTVLDLNNIIKKETNNYYFKENNDNRKKEKGTHHDNKTYFFKQ